MKFDKQKAFPYPVLRPHCDDYLDVEFQVSPDFEADGNEITAEITYALSSKEIADEIKKGNAEYAVIISCRDTYFRTFVSSQDKKTEIKFENGELRGEVRVDPYIVVKKEIPTFTSPDINPEFGAGPFKFGAGDILAQDEPYIVYIDRDMFKPVTSVFELVKKDGLADGLWTMGFEEDHIQIEVNQKTKATLDDARNSKSNKVVLINSIYFAAVMQAVQKIQSDGAAYEGKKWFDVIQRQAVNKGCNIESDEAYYVAEHLMKYPLNLLEQYIFKG